MEKGLRLLNTLSTTYLPYGYVLLSTWDTIFLFFCSALSTFKPLNAENSNFNRLQIAVQKTGARLKPRVPRLGVTLKRVLQNFELLNS